MIRFKTYINEANQEPIADERIVINWLNNHLGMLARTLQDKTKEVKAKTGPAGPDTTKFKSTAEAGVKSVSNISVPRGGGLRSLAIKNGVKIGSAIDFTNVTRPEVQNLLNTFASNFGVKAGSDFASVKTAQGNIVRVWFIYGTSYSVLGYTIDKLGQ